MDIATIVQFLESVNLNDGCGGLGFLVRLIKFGVFPILQIGIPIILIVFGTIDLGKAVIASDEKQVKEAQSKLIKRCIYAIVVFFIVTIVQLLTSMVAGAVGGGEGEAAAGVNNWAECWNNTNR